MAGGGHCRADAQGQLAGRHPSTPSHALSPPHTQNRASLCLPRASYQEEPWISRSKALSDLTPGASSTPAIITAAGASAWEAGQQAQAGHLGSAHLHPPLSRPRPSQGSEGSLQPAGGSVTAVPVWVYQRPLLLPARARTGGKLHSG